MSSVLKQLYTLFDGGLVLSTVMVVIKTTHVERVALEIIWLVISAEIQTFPMNSQVGAVFVWMPTAMVA